MNIPLSQAVAAAPSRKSSRRPKKNVLAQPEDSSDDSDNNDNQDEEAAGGRAAVNRALIREQDAVRARVRAAEAADTTGVYDYDGAYDSFRTNPPETDGASAQSQQQETQQSSRYIGELLQAAERRKRERDVVYERRVMREQAAEEAADPALRGKEMFVTAAYKRQLEERKLWQAREEQEQRAEQDNDVTRRPDDGMANFYGNWNRNVALGGMQVKTQHQQQQEQQTAIAVEGNDNLTMPSFLDGFAKRDNDEEPDHDEPGPETVKPNMASKPKDENIQEEDPEERRKRMRLLREEKLAQARIRYFQRQAAKQKSDPAVV